MSVMAHSRKEFLSMSIEIVEAYYKPARFPMQIGTIWEIGEQLEETDAMTGADFWNLQLGNRARGIDDFGNEYVLWTYIGTEEHYLVGPFDEGFTYIGFAVRPFNEGNTYKAIWVRETYLEFNRKSTNIDLNKLRRNLKK